MRASNSFVGTEEYIAPVCILSWFFFIQHRFFCHVFIFPRFFHDVENLILISLIVLQEIITGAGHTSAVDWWALGKQLFYHLCSFFVHVVMLMKSFGYSGILLYEMLYGYTPFRGKTRQRTFANILHKDIRFPASISVMKQAANIYYDIFQTKFWLLWRIRKTIYCLTKFTRSGVV
jgi:serine/threonine protein kinase